MDGDITVSSEQSKGSVFSFTLRVPKTEMPKELVPLDAAVLQGKRVLVVDDHPVNVRVLTRQLRQWGMRVATAESGLLALDVMERGVLPDAVITDMHMPGMDDLELARRIRGMPECARLPLILLSSGFMPGSAASSPFNARLLKPARQNQLFEALARCLSPDGLSVPQSLERLDIKKGITVLVADDNAVNLIAACGVLARLGYDWTTVSDGTQAVAAVASSIEETGHRFGAVLMDLHMPGMDGLQATQVIHRMFGADAPPIIALTADASVEDRARCMEAGMDDYLTKPLQVSDLTRALARWTDSTPEGIVNAAKVAKVESSGPASGNVSAAASNIALSAGPPKAPHPTAMNFSRLNEFGEFNDNLHTVREVLRLFMADVPRNLAAITEACGQGNADRLSEAAHTLRCSASNVGAEALHALSAKINDSASAGVIPADMDNLNQRLQDAWLLTQAELKAWLEAGAHAPADAG
ncbi:MAG: response regulator [Polaromonas sp.]|nr:response regulator [Polaromonas sp.]